MSGIYIPGVEMPTTCKDCRLSIFTDFDSMLFCAVTMDDICLDDWETKRCDNCPLVPVPPHGRLIDADALERELREDAEDLLEQFPHTGTRTTWFEAYEHFADIVAVDPTIIEADKGAGE